ncbi:HET domain-containing protein [Trichoderma evansii]
MFVIPVEDLCAKCRGLPWDLPPNHDESWLPVNHYQSLRELRNSADNGCRTCQICWLYIIDEINAEMDDEIELKFTWKNTEYTARVMIEDLSQSWTRGGDLKLAENICMKESQIAIGNQIRGYKRKFATWIPVYLRDDPFTIDLPDLVHLRRHRDFLGGGLEYSLRNIIKPWVDDCIKNHRGCRQVQQFGFGNRAPTRLIDVGTACEDTIKLVYTGESAMLQYLILSYCWGESNDKSKTTQANIEQRKKSIRISELPKTIRDAITITRLMGVQYLWADAICIIQEDKENNDGFLDDWKKEAAKMGSYYSNALCCISNLGAADSSEGFLREKQTGLGQEGQRRRFQLYDEREIEYFWHKGRRLAIHLPAPVQYWHMECQSSPLLRRAWALQEWILSCRTLHWTNAGIFMECSGGICQAKDPFQKPVADWNHTLDNDIGNILRESAELHVGDLWTKLVTFYSTMNLTNPTDRLIAIDGITRLICAKYNTGYFAGVLSSHIAQTLLWKRSGLTDPGNPATSFPSWSWSSTMNVEFPELGRRTCYIKCTDDKCFLPTYEAMNYADRSTRRFPLQGPVLPLSLASWPNLKLSLFDDIYNGPIWKNKPIILAMDSMDTSNKLKEYTKDRKRVELLGQWKLLVCVRSFVNDESRIYDDFDHKYNSSYYGLVIEELKDAGKSAYQRIGFFEVCIQETEESDYNIERWMADINLF